MPRLPRGNIPVITEMWRSERRKGLAPGIQSDIGQRGPLFKQIAWDPDFAASQEHN